MLSTAWSLLCREVLDAVSNAVHHNIEVDSIISILDGTLGSDESDRDLTPYVSLMGVLIKYGDASHSDLKVGFKDIVVPGVCI